MALEINDDAFLIRSGGVWILSGELGVTQLAVPLRAMSNFISCTNMKIPHGCNYEVYTTVREEEKEDGERGGGGETVEGNEGGEVCICLLDGGQRKTWQKL